jgi:tetratricopeptide (TPR) repeat protein
MKVEILQCNGCGANISPDNTTCIYCGSENIVVSSNHPLIVEEKQAKKITNYFKAKVKEDPTDGESLFALGMFYLNLKLYDLAIKNFESAITYIPNEADAYYYYALSLIRGKRPKSMNLKDIRKIEEYLNTAIQLDDKANYYYLAAIINYDYYAGNGMRIPKPDYNELLSEADTAEKDKTEVDVLIGNVIIRDEQLLQIIQN